MILKSIIMLSAFVTFSLPILHRLDLIYAPRLIFYGSCFLFLLGKYSRPPPQLPENETMKTMLIQNLG